MKPSQSKFPGKRLTLSYWAICLAFVAIVLAAIPTPYFLISPGDPTDLATVIAVEGTIPSQARFYSTTVKLQPMHALFALDAFAPATQIVPKSFVVPLGQTTEWQDAVGAAAMDDSQHTAAYVAERAAGYRVAPPLVSITVTGFPPGSFATPALQEGDRLLQVGGRTLHSLADVDAGLAGLRADARARVRYERAGRIQVADVRLRPTSGGRLGVGLFARQGVELARLPIPVHFADVHAVGSSAGLMFALQIYADLKHLRVAGPVAGTGTLSIDGSVASIRGTRQKLEAARRVGARVFLVPAANVADVQGEHGILVVPVTSFAAALRYLEQHPS